MRGTAQDPFVLKLVYNLLVGLQYFIHTLYRNAVTLALT